MVAVGVAVVVGVAVGVVVGVAVAVAVGVVVVVGVAVVVAVAVAVDLTAMPPRINRGKTEGSKMNINDLTIGQAKELAAMFSGQTTQTPREHPFVGKYVIARCYSAGVHAGEVVSVDGENVILKDSRRLWSWQAKDGIALSGVAQHGIRKEKSKIDVINPEIYLTGVCELIPASAAARESIHGG